MWIFGYTAGRCPQFHIVLVSTPRSHYDVLRINTSTYLLKGYNSIHVTLFIKLFLFIEQNVASYLELSNNNLLETAQSPPVYHDGKYVGVRVVLNSKLTPAFYSK